jgi:hypothetical protein
MIKIRWKNTLVKPNSDSEIQLFCAKYPALFLIPVLFMTGLGYYFWLIFTEFEQGKRDSVWVGEFKILYDLFGKWGIVGFFGLVAFGFLYLFWIYAIRESKNKN